ncbi:MAG: DUF1592 domain-containing protein [Pirellulaceae bacterium]|nr:DUF1592 domain-containing protein [Pirellulaceae bacterium]
MPIRPQSVVVWCLLVLCCLSRTTPLVDAEEPPAFDALRQQYQQQTLPLLRRFCLDCHSSEEKAGELDLERFGSLDQIRRQPEVWQQVVAMLDNREMPPEDQPQPSDEQRGQLRGWIADYLWAEARAQAGDPGPVVLRRLNNAEYTWSIRDLTGIELNPAREFPVDGAAGEGFTNTGQALAMSPALLQKYLDAAKEVTEHTVLLPAGLRFSPGTTRRDWTNEIVAEIRQLYRQHTSGNQDVSSLDRWSQADPARVTGEDGRVDLRPYFAALIEHRQQLLDDLAPIEAIASHRQLNANYLRGLARALASAEPRSELLNDLRTRWRSASPAQAAELADLVAAWRDRLWKTNPVGHFGSVRPWHEPVDPLRSTAEFRVKIARPESGDDITLFLVAGGAGLRQTSRMVQWSHPRIERLGRTPIRLTDLRAATAVFNRLRQQMAGDTQRYLAAAHEVRAGQSNLDLNELAERHQVDPPVLQAWLAYLGISIDGQVALGEHLSLPLRNVAGHDFVQGWGMEGQDALSVLANSSDQTVHIPGRMPPHTVCVHPRPERWVAAGWKSPLAGRVRLVPRVHDAHPACGNGIQWSLELRRGHQRRVLREGHVDLGGTATIEPVDELAIRKGDVVSLVIGPRDANYVCDLTEIDLAVEQLDGPRQQWKLSTDCADSIGAGNPHADRLGNPAVWHFHTGRLDGAASPAAVPAESLLAGWLDATDSDQARQLAARVQALVAGPPDASLPPADRVLREQLTAPAGPLLSQLDFTKLAALATPADLASARHGVDSRELEQLGGARWNGNDLLVPVPAVLPVRLPAAMLADSELVLTGTLVDAGDQQPDEHHGVQVQVVSTRPSEPLALAPDAPILVPPGSPAERRWRQAFTDFRQLFPAAMCYARIVPVDEVVTLVLFHREDEPLGRLMLDEAQRQRLDQLWEELRYVSQDALIGQTAFEQLMEFATQDGDPRLFEPLREPIQQRAAEYRRWQEQTEPAHLAAVLELAARAFRRPLSSGEADGLRAFYAELRRQSQPHETAIRLTLARVLVSPAFLYRLEQPAAGAARGPVSDWELASRLSYFLWSSLPDNSLRQAAAEGRLHEPDVLVAETRRLLRDDRVRRLAVEFACQWLHLRDFDQTVEKSERHFPTFADMRGEMYEESIQFFTDLFENDRSILDILDADHTFLNARLAEHYGIPEIAGQQWRRVDGVRQYGRGGILAQASFLSSQAGASRTSPILRGNWISETLLGERLPRPPQDVPQLPAEAPGGLTERQLIEQHSSAPACAKCHERIDPLGFALESFDAIGRRRAEDSQGQPIDVRTTLRDGTPIQGLDGLREYMTTARRRTFVRQFCRKLLGFSLGRSVQLSDEPLLERIERRLEANDYRVAVAVEEIVMSEQFRMIRGKETGP